MRILLDEAQLGWDEAWDLTQRTLAYTNHTLLPEALEKWPLDVVRGAAAAPPGDHLRDQPPPARRRAAALPGRRGPRRAREPDRGRRRRKHVRMANLAIVGSHSTNGVAAIHSELLRTTTVKDLAEMFPERFNNKTNGVTPRRWLLLANPALARTITEAIGDGWITDLSQLRQAQAAGRRQRLSRRVPQGQARGQGAVCRLAQSDDRARRSIRTRSSIARSSASTNTSGNCSMRCASWCSTTGCGRTRTSRCRRGRSSSPARRRRPTSSPS